MYCWHDLFPKSQTHSAHRGTVQEASCKCLCVRATPQEGLCHGHWLLHHVTQAVLSSLSPGRVAEMGLPWYSTWHRLSKSNRHSTCTRCWILFRDRHCSLKPSRQTGPQNSGMATEQCFLSRWTGGWKGQRGGGDLPIILPLEA